ncbi:MAG: hypothetical protein J4O08_05570 [Chloroflexi bacterium]|nr:hypothetical protein [Chloroflexota bacterium]MCH8868634.1 hypothetical protein [Chloroflexota bacterium]MCH9040468.1 hypothetical protein [Chloroflexota bacterium]MCI0790989.1 hypothetical protein [Chloroflexota bacterium]MCI0813241.1 hypothetical protein [Chloroflexota bacterium]
MQPVSININVKSQDIPTLICTDYSKQNQFTSYISDMAESLARSLGVEDFLHNPSRVDELRRRLWQAHPSL